MDTDDIMSEVLKHQAVAADPSRCVWVTANAGSGKTKVLVDRVLRLLVQGASPAHILCVTYTNAAAAEMVARIERMAGRWANMAHAHLAAEIGILLGRVAQQHEVVRAHNLAFMLYDAYPALRVMTIHAFCQEIVSRFPQEAGIAPHATIAEEEQLAQFIYNAQQCVLQEAVSSPEGALAWAITYLTEHISDVRFQEIVQTIIAHRTLFACVQGDEMQFHTAIATLYAAHHLPVDMELVTLADVYFPLSTALQQHLQHIKECLRQTVLPTDHRTADMIEAVLHNATDWEKRHCFASGLLTQKGTPHTRLITAKPKALLQQHPPLYEEWEALLARAATYMEKYHVLHAVRLSHAVLVVARRLYHHYAAQKAAAHMLDYDDLIEKAVALVEDTQFSPWVLYKLDGEITHLLLDEAQDTAGAGWRLINALTQEFFAGQGVDADTRSLFVVGDEKQSIYGFQGAVPATFIQQADVYHQRAMQVQRAIERVPLYVSFRSTSTVLAFIDAVFANEERMRAVTYGREEVRHYAFRSQKAGRICLYPRLEKEEPMH